MDKNVRVITCLQLPLVGFLCLGLDKDLPRGTDLVLHNQTHHNIHLDHNLLEHSVTKFTL